MFVRSEFGLDFVPSGICFIAGGGPASGGAASGGTGGGPSGGGGGNGGPNGGNDGGNSERRRTGLRPIETKKAKRIKKTNDPKKLLKDKDSFADEPPTAPLTDVAFAERRSRGRTGSSILSGRGLGDSSGAPNIFRQTLGA